MVMEEIMSFFNKIFKNKSNDENVKDDKKVARGNQKKSSDESKTREIKGTSKEDYRRVKEEKRAAAAKKRAEEAALEKVKEEKRQLEEEEEKKKREAERQQAYAERREAKKASIVNEQEYRDDEEEEVDFFGYTIPKLELRSILNVEILSDMGDGYAAMDKDSFIEVFLPKEEANEEVNIGDVVEVVLYRQPNGEQYVSQKRLKTVKNLSNFNEVFESKETVEGKIVSFKEPFYTVELDDGFKAKLYKRNYQLSPLQDEEEVIGNVDKYVITDNRSKGKLAFEVSRIPLLLEEMEENVAEVEEGKVIPIGSFDSIKGGLVFEYKGFRIFVPLSEVSHSFVGRDTNLTDVVSDDAQVKIIEVRKKRNGYNVVGSIKATTDSPFEKFVEQYEVDDEVTGTVVRIEKYGIFAEVTDGIVGLLHRSDFSNEIAATIKEIEVGDSLQLFIGGIDTDKQKVSLKASK